MNNPSQRNNNGTKRTTTVETRHTASLLLLLLILPLAGCHRSDNGIRFHRFEQLLFETPVAELQQTLMARAGEYDTPLLNIAPESPEFMAMLTDFTSDSTIRYIYRTTDSLYHDLSDVERDLTKAMQRAEKECPWMHYTDFYTMLTADFDDYHNRVFCDQSTLAVSIDRYALPQMTRYQSFGVPIYLQNLLQREYIVADCMAAIARANIMQPEGEPTLLDYAIAEGKTQFFLEQTLPSTPDTIRLRYSREQMKWMKANTANVWGWIIQNQMLYCTDYTQLRGIIDDAPKTNAFGEGSAPRATDYIGWQIVRRYMKKTGATMRELFEETDSQKILTLSGWRP